MKGEPEFPRLALGLSAGPRSVPSALPRCQGVSAIVPCHVGDAQSDGQPRAVQPRREGHNVSCPTFSSPPSSRHRILHCYFPPKTSHPPSESPGVLVALFSFSKEMQFPFPYLAPSSLDWEGSQPPTLALHLFLMVNSQKYYFCASL